MTFLQRFQNEQVTSEEGFADFQKMHDAPNYFSELKFAANLLFLEDYHLSRKFAKVFYIYESEYHYKKFDNPHICIKQFLVIFLFCRWADMMMLIKPVPV